MKQSALKGTAALSAGQICSQGFSFLRNVIVARLLSPEDFGIAATFTITVSLLEMVSNLAAETLLIQAPDGDQECLQKSAQMIQALRGLLIALTILCLALPFSLLFEVPEAKWAFQCLAIVPLIRGFAHLDLNRFQRKLKFGPAIWVELASSALIALAAWPLTVWLQDYSALLWLLIAKACITLIGSHVVAQRRYRWTWDTLYLRRIFVWGWPLLINGALLFGIFQGDRLIVGANYTMSELGVYSVAFSLTMLPTLMFKKIHLSLVLPLLSAVQMDHSRFELRYKFSAQIVSIVGGCLAIMFIMAGGWFVVLIYGEKYRAAADFIGWLGAMQAVRLFRSVPTEAAMAHGDTKNAMISNMFRSVTLPIALAVALSGRNLSWIAIAGLTGELFGLFVAVFRLRKKQGIRMSIYFFPLLVAVGGAFIATLAMQNGIKEVGWLASVASALVIMVVMAGTIGIMLALNLKVSKPLHVR